MVSTRPPLYPDATWGSALTRLGARAAIVRGRRRLERRARLDDAPLLRLADALARRDDDPPPAPVVADPRWLDTITGTGS